MYKRVIYWFKRDLRIEDNKAFYEACVKSKELIPIFIFTPELLEKFESFDERLGFIIDCLKSLNKRIKEKDGTLYIFLENHKPKKLAVIAAMRKLLLIAHAVYKNKVRFSID